MIGFDYTLEKCRSPKELTWDIIRFLWIWRFCKSYVKW